MLGLINIGMVCPYSPQYNYAFIDARALFLILAVPVNYMNALCKGLDSNITRRRTMQALHEETPEDTTQ